MPARPSEALFLRTTDHLVASGRRVFLAILALLLLHALTVTPWVEHDRASTFASAEEERFAAIRDITTRKDGLESALQEMGGLLLTALGRLTENLEKDLERLEETVRTLAASGAPPEVPGLTPGEPDPPDMAGVPELAFAIADADQLVALRDAIADGSRYGLLAALDPIVESAILTPRFGELRSSWNDGARPRLEGELEAAARAIPSLRLTLPEAEESWDVLQGSLTGLRSLLNELSFEPPSEPYWWAVTDGPAPAPGEIDLGLTTELTDRLTRPPGVDELAVAGERAQENFRELIFELETFQRRSQAQSPSRDAGAFAGLLIGLGVDPRTLAELFPLLLGVLLGAAILRRTQRLRELAAAARWAVDDGDDPGPRRWCLAQIAGRFTSGSGASRNEDSGTEARRRGSWRALGALVLALGWIAAAAFQVRSLEGLDERRWLIVTLAGAAAVVIATLHRLVALGRCVEILMAGTEPEPTGGFLGPLTDDEPIPAGDTLPRTEAPPPRPEGPRSFLDDRSEDSGTGEIVIDGHTLRR